MSWYYGTFSCGHEGRVNIIGPNKNRQWKADKRFEGKCEECYAKWLQEERERINKEALEKAVEMELPELTGTEKQISWGNTIRDKFIDKIDYYLNNIDRVKEDLKFNRIEDLSKKEISSIAENLNDIMDYILVQKTKSTWFIDNRDSLVDALLKIYREMEAKDDLKELLEQQIIKEGTISPSNVVHNGIVNINADENLITASYEKNEDFRLILKDLKYSWKNGRWEREISESTGSYIDRAAELGNRLLNEGFSISIQDKDIREKAVNGDFEYECDRWIYGRANTSKFAIRWQGYDRNLYDDAKGLPGARWENGAMLVDISHFEEVEEFAELFEFKFSQKAVSLIDKYKEELTKVDTVDVEEVEKYTPKDGLSEILESSREIIPDLIDD
ncbi:hypothetical protein [Clostridium ihumii]|uniref:hypothetical protein n=1 Tax=Clostridium ihumii TaxID=1470356 RepID=UPI00058E49CF|nr:hypothetical protein [Clostridium ihumii]